MRWGTRATTQVQIPRALFKATNLGFQHQRKTPTGLLAAHAALRDSSLEEAVAAVGNRALAVSLAILLIAIISVGGEARGFIYFQF